MSATRTLSVTSSAASVSKRALHHFRFMQVQAESSCRIYMQFGTRQQTVVLLADAD